MLLNVTRLWVLHFTSLVYYLRQMHTTHAVNFIFLFFIFFGWCIKASTSSGNERNWFSVFEAKWKEEKQEKEDKHEYIYTNAYTYTNQQQQQQNQREDIPMKYKQKRRYWLKYRIKSIYQRIFISINALPNKCTTSCDSNHIIDHSFCINFRFVVVLRWINWYCWCCRCFKFSIGNVFVLQLMSSIFPHHYLVYPISQKQQQDEKKQQATKRKKKRKIIFILLEFIILWYLTRQWGIHLLCYYII